MFIRLDEFIPKMGAESSVPEVSLVDLPDVTAALLRCFDLFNHKAADCRGRSSEPKLQEWLCIAVCARFLTRSQYAHVFALLPRPDGAPGGLDTALFDALSVHAEGRMPLVASTGGSESRARRTADLGARHGSPISAVITTAPAAQAAAAAGKEFSPGQQHRLGRSAARALDLLRLHGAAAAAATVVAASAAYDSAAVSQRPLSSSRVGRPLSRSQAASAPGASCAESESSAGRRSRSSAHAASQIHNRRLTSRTGSRRHSVINLLRGPKYHQGCALEAESALASQASSGSTAQLGRKLHTGASSDEVTAAAVTVPAAIASQAATCLSESPLTLAGVAGSGRSHAPSNPRSGLHLSLTAVMAALGQASAPSSRSEAAADAADSAAASAATAVVSVAELFSLLILHCRGSPQDKARLLCSLCASVLPSPQQISAAFPAKASGPMVAPNPSRSTPADSLRCHRASDDDAASAQPVTALSSLRLTPCSNAFKLEHVSTSAASLMVDLCVSVWQLTGQLPGQLKRSHIATLREGWLASLATSGPSRMAQAQVVGVPQSGDDSELQGAVVGTDCICNWAEMCGAAERDHGHLVASAFVQQLVEPQAPQAEAGPAHGPATQSAAKVHWQASSPSPSPTHQSESGLGTLSAKDEEKEKEHVAARTSAATDHDSLRPAIQVVSARPQSESGPVSVSENLTRQAGPAATSSPEPSRRLRDTSGHASGATESHPDGRSTRRGMCSVDNRGHAWWYASLNGPSCALLLSFYLAQSFNGAVGFARAHLALASVASGAAKALALARSIRTDQHALSLHTAPNALMLKKPQATAAGRLRGDHGDAALAGAKVVASSELQVEGKDPVSAAAELVGVSIRNLWLRAALSLSSPEQAGKVTALPSAVQAVQAADTRVMTRVVAAKWALRFVRARAEADAAASAAQLAPVVTITDLEPQLEATWAAAALAAGPRGRDALGCEWDLRVTAIGSDSEPRMSGGPIRVGGAVLGPIPVELGLGVAARVGLKAEQPLPLEESGHHHDAEAEAEEVPEVATRDLTAAAPVGGNGSVMMITAATSTARPAVRVQSTQSLVEAMWTTYRAHADKASAAALAEMQQAAEAKLAITRARSTRETAFGDLRFASRVTSLARDPTIVQSLLKRQELRAAQGGQTRSRLASSRLRLDSHSLELAVGPQTSPGPRAEPAGVQMLHQIADDAASGDASVPVHARHGSSLHHDAQAAARSSLPLHPTSHHDAAAGAAQEIARKRARAIVESLQQSHDPGTVHGTVRRMLASPAGKKMAADAVAAENSFANVARTLEAAVLQLELAERAAAAARHGTDHALTTPLESGPRSFSSRGMAESTSRGLVRTATAGIYGGSGSESNLKLLKLSGGGGLSGAPTVAANGSTTSATASQASVDKMIAASTKRRVRKMLTSRAAVAWLSHAEPRAGSDSVSEEPEEYESRHSVCEAITPGRERHRDGRKGRSTAEGAVDSVTDKDESESGYLRRNLNSPVDDVGVLCLASNDAQPEHRDSLTVPRLPGQERLLSPPPLTAAAGPSQAAARSSLKPQLSPILFPRRLKPSAGVGDTASLSISLSMPSLSVSKSKAVTSPLPMGLQASSRVRASLRELPSLSSPSPPSPMSLPLSPAAFLSASMQVLPKPSATTMVAAGSTSCRATATGSLQIESRGPGHHLNGRHFQKDGRSNAHRQLPQSDPSGQRHGVETSPKRAHFWDDCKAEAGEPSERTPRHDHLCGGSGTRVAADYQPLLSQMSGCESPSSVTLTPAARGDLSECSDSDSDKDVISPPGLPVRVHSPSATSTDAETEFGSSARSLRLRQPDSIMMIARSAASSTGSALQRLGSGSTAAFSPIHEDEGAQAGATCSPSRPGPGAGLIGGTTSPLAATSRAGSTSPRRGGHARDMWGRLLSELHAPVRSNARSNLLAVAAASRLPLKVAAPPAASSESMAGESGPGSEFTVTRREHRDTDAYAYTPAHADAHADAHTDAHTDAGAVIQVVAAAAVPRARAHRSIGMDSDGPTSSVNLSLSLRVGQLRPLPGARAEHYRQAATYPDSLAELPAASDSKADSAVPVQAKALPSPLLTQSQTHRMPPSRLGHDPHVPVAASMSESHHDEALPLPWLPRPLPRLRAQHPGPPPLTGRIVWLDGRTSHAGRGYGHAADRAGLGAESSGAKPRLPLSSFQAAASAGK